MSDKSTGIKADCEKMRRMIQCKPMSADKRALYLHRIDSCDKLCEMGNIECGEAARELVLIGCAVMLRAQFIPNLKIGVFLRLKHKKIWCAHCSQITSLSF